MENINNFNEEYLFQQIQVYTPEDLPLDVDFSNFYYEALISRDDIDSSQTIYEPINEQLDSSKFNFTSSSSDLELQFESYRIDLLNKEMEDELKRAYSWKRLILHYRPLRVDGGYLLKNKAILKAIGNSVKLYDRWLNELVSCYCEGSKNDGQVFIDKWNATVELNKNLFLTQLKDLSSLASQDIPESIKQLLEEKRDIDIDELNKYNISISKINNYKSNVEKRNRSNRQKEQ